MVSKMKQKPAHTIAGCFLLFLNILPAIGTTPDPREPSAASNSTLMILAQPKLQTLSNLSPVKIAKPSGEPQKFQVELINDPHKLPLEAIIGLMGGLLGVGLGFGLTAGYDLWKEARKAKTIKEALLKELLTNLHTIPFKRDIISKMTAALNRAEVLPGESVPFSSSIYDSHISSFTAKVNALERNSLHVIYSSLKQIDSMMAEYHRSIMGAINSESFDDVVEMERANLRSIVLQLGVVEKLMSKHLAGTPEDVLYIEVPYEDLKKKMIVDAVTGRAQADPATRDPRLP